MKTCLLCHYYVCLFWIRNGSAYLIITLNSIHSSLASGIHTDEEEQSLPLYVKRSTDQDLTNVERRYSRRWYALFSGRVRTAKTNYPLKAFYFRYRALVEGAPDSPTRLFSQLGTYINILTKTFLSLLRAFFFLMAGRFNCGHITQGHFYPGWIPTNKSNFGQNNRA